MNHYAFILAGLVALAVGIAPVPAQTVVRTRTTVTETEYTIPAGTALPSAAAYEVPVAPSIYAYSAAPTYYTQAGPLLYGSGYYGGFGVRDFRVRNFYGAGVRVRDFGGYGGGVNVVNVNSGRFRGGSVQAVQGGGFGGGAQIVNVNERRGLFGRVRERNVSVVQAGGGGANVANVNVGRRR